MNTESGRMTLHAPAKINLLLRVLGRRSDGYHDLETWMQKLLLHDTLELELFPGSGVIFSCDDPSVPSDAANLAVKAAEAFFAACRRSDGYGARIHLQKRIPVAAGLGGGSSDAGTVLRGLNTFFGGEFSDGELIDIARPLGADVPFFAVEHNAVLAGGIGDVMYPVDSMGDCSFILVNPGFFVSTAWVFQNLTLTRPPKNSKLSCFQKYKSTPLSFSEMHNDLEQVTCAKHPEIDKIKESLTVAGAVKVLMSGSGPTVFGIFPDAEKTTAAELERIVCELRREYGAKVYLSRACTG
ncbi:MAG: hypothetical protein ACD_75C01914G0001, partial [uncultured bacterium]